MKKIENWKIISLFIMLYDALSAVFAYGIGLWVRFDFNYSGIPSGLMNAFLHFIPIYIVVLIVTNIIFHLYRCIWQFVSFDELIRILEAWLIESIIHAVCITVFFRRMPISYYLIGAVVQAVLMVGIRFAYRFYLKFSENRKPFLNGRDMKNIMIIGAGESGQTILRDIKRRYEDNLRVSCFIDDDTNKWQRLVEGVPVVGGRDDILQSVEKYSIRQILLAIPSATAEQKRDLINICNETSCEVKILPGIYQLVKDEVTIANMKDVAIEDLLGRDPIKIDMAACFEFINGKTILVTGGGGSIGSELCRQIAAHSPKQLIIFDIYENNAYAIEQELKANYPQLNLAVIIGSVRDSRRVNQVFKTYRPEVVYHAAAHKHVPLMETSPNEAIKNNVIGTYKTAYAALAYGCKRFVHISTDKAVNPTNIMGASKRLCEMVIQTMDAISKSGSFDKLPLVHAHKEIGFAEMDEADILPEAAEHARIAHNKSRTEFVAVRFGNVLGSNGSVIPLFKKQIENGGPVTVTHPEIIRYFMTIPEAVSLVLQAGVNAHGGEIFVLDMGAPVKIDTLARNLIKLSGFKPDVDIKIVYTGLREGEKLYEEKLMAEEGLQKTENGLIHIAHPINLDTDHFLSSLVELANASYYNSDNIVEIVEGIVPTFHPVGKNGQSDKAIKSKKYKEVAAGIV